MSLLPFDGDASAPSNYKLDQDKTLSSGAVKVAVLPDGLFYSKDLVVRDGILGTPLQHQVDYTLLHMSEEIFRITGKAAYAAIAVKKPSVQSITVDCRFVGGASAITAELLQDIVDIIENDERPVHFGQIYGLPQAFFPTQHMHSLNDFSFSNIHQAVLKLVQIGSLNNEETLSQFLHYAQSIAGQVEVDANDLIPHTHMSLLFTAANMQICIGQIPGGDRGDRHDIYFRRRFSAPPNVHFGGRNLLNNAVPDPFIVGSTQTNFMRVELNTDADVSSVDTVGPCTYLAIGPSNASESINVTPSQPV